MKVKKLPRPKSHDEWLEQRRLGITGTDIAGLMGLSSYKSPVSIFIEKTYPQVPKPPSEQMELGIHMEDPIAKFWLKRNPGHLVRKVETTLVHHKFPWVRCNIDRHIVRPNERLLEIKLVGIQKSGEWKNDGLPDEYKLQCMWQMIVTGLPVVNVAALIGGTTYEERVVEYDKVLAQSLLDLAHDFWHDHVLKNSPPAIDGSDATTDAINAMFGGPDHEQALAAAIAFGGDDKIDLDFEADLLIGRYAIESDIVKERQAVMDAAAEDFIRTYQGLKKEVLDHLADKNAVANQLRWKVGHFEKARTAAGAEVSWKTTSSTRIDTTKLRKDYPQIADAYSNTSSSRRLTIKPAK
jgi:putative phage-type endonuclease